jgi:hypothetical protein
MLHQQIVAERYVEDDGLRLYGQDIFTIQVKVCSCKNNFDLHSYVLENLPHLIGYTVWIPPEVLDGMVEAGLVSVDASLLTKEWTFFYEFFD